MYNFIQGLDPYETLDIGINRNETKHLRGKIILKIIEEIGINMSAMKLNEIKILIQKNLDNKLRFETFVSDLHLMTNELYRGHISYRGVNGIFKLINYYIQIELK